MEVQISPAASFNAADRKMLRESSKKSFEPMAKRLKSDLTFQCIVCNDIYNDLDAMYDHMRNQHPELYAHENEEVIDLDREFGNNEDVAHIDLDHELSDEEYTDLSRLLEPICELRQIDDDDENDFVDKLNASESTTEEQLRLQLQLQLQLQKRLLQLQMNKSTSLTNGGGMIGRPLTLRKHLSSKLKYN